MMGMRLLIALALSTALAAQAQESYPQKSVRLIAAAAPGGNPDVLARLMAAKLADMFGKPFIVENIPGAGGVVAAELLARAPTDGHVLMLGDSGALAINPALNSTLTYQPLRSPPRSPRCRPCWSRIRRCRRRRSMNSSRSPNCNRVS